MGNRIYLADRVMVTTATSGSGTYALGSAVSTFLTFAQGGIADGQKVTYGCVSDLTTPTTWEIGEGVYTSSGTTLSRTAIHRTSNGDTTAISWPNTNTKYLFIMPSAARLPMYEDDGLLRLPSGLIITSGGITGAGTLAWTGSATFTGTVSAQQTMTAANGTSGTQVVNYGQFTPVTKAATGTMTLPNGVIQKWGTGSTTAGVGTVTFATAFPTACRNVQLTVNSGSATGQYYVVFVGTVSASSFAVWGDSGQNIGFFWFAIGD